MIVPGLAATSEPILLAGFLGFLVVVARFAVYEFPSVHHNQGAADFINSGRRATFGRYLNKALLQSA